ncbi:MAG: hypothetical protein J1F05_08575 [Muribaculaceae bacterium]|nr:hypothetical protein [Muribaculaceae bacterium]
MKKILLGMLAFAMLFTTSCSEELETGYVAGQDAKVSVNLNFPTMQSRAYSDGTTATQLQYAVYEKKDAGLQRIDSYTVTNATINISTKVDFQLVTGRTYVFVFWAASPESPYQVSFSDPEHTAKMSYKADATLYANDENLDAFFKTVEKTITGDVEMSVELTRPFAQINVGTNDFKVAKELGAAPNRSCLVVTSAYKELDLLTGAVIGDAEKITFGFGPIPGQTYNDKEIEAESFPVAGYDYLAMAYILADTEEEVLSSVNFQYVLNADAATRQTKTVGSVPVKRNHRTNLFGQVLTSNAELNIIIKPEYEEPDYNYDQLLFAAAVGGSVVLTDDVEVPGELTFTKDAVVDLNGHEIKAEGGQYGDALVFGNGANVIMRNGTIYPSENASEQNASATILVKTSSESHLTLENMTVVGEPYAIYVNSANEATSVTIKSGTYYTNTENGNGPAVYVACPPNLSNKIGGKVTIEGGTFGKAGEKNDYLLNVYDELRTPKTDKEPRDFIEVFGGTFINFNPANNKAEGEGTNFVAEGYKVVETQKGADTYYTVVPADAIELKSGDNFNEALKELAEGNVTEATIILADGEFSFKPSTSTGAVTIPSNAKLTFVGGGADVTSLVNADYFDATGCTLEFSNLSLKVFENSTNHTAMRFSGAVKTTFTNVDIYGEYHAVTGENIFDGCKFYFAGGGKNQTRYGLYCESEGKTTLTGCTFDTSSKNDDRETKGILVYSAQGNTVMGDIDISDCKFLVSGTASTKAAIEIHSELFTKAGTLTINNVTYDEGKYIALWREIHGSTNAATTYYTVIENGVVKQQSTH